MTRPVPPSLPSHAGPADPDRSSRPATYWPEEGLRHALLGNLLGEARHGLIQQALESCTGDIPPEALLNPELTPSLRELLGRIHPRFMGGEYLPGYQPGEVEIARVALESTTADVIALRARQRKDGFIQYRIVDEYDGTYEFTPRRSRIPLTLGELITLLDGAGSDGSSLVLGPLEGNLDGGADLESLRGFVTVRSHFYPELEAHYRKVCAAFLDARLPQEDEDEAWGLGSGF